MTFTKICPACSGNGYVPDSDGEQTGYRDCEVCDSQGVVPVTFEETQTISCIQCGARWNIPKGDAEEDGFLNCCPTCTPESWDADPSNLQGTA